MERSRTRPIGSTEHLGILGAGWPVPCFFSRIVSHHAVRDKVFLSEASLDCDPNRTPLSLGQAGTTTWDIRNPDVIC